MQFINKKLLLVLFILSFVLFLISLIFLFSKNIFFTFSNVWSILSWGWIIFSLLFLFVAFIYFFRLPLFEKLINVLKLPIKYIGYLFFSLFIFSVISLITIISFVPSISSSTKSSNSNSTGVTQSPKKWKIISDDGKMTGIAKTTNIHQNSIVIGFVVLVQDGLVNNGKCIDLEGTYCQESTANSSWEEKRYFYGILFSNTVNDSFPAGSEVLPVFCNKEAVINNPEDMVYGSGKMLDINCDTNAYNWKATDTLIMQNSTSVKSIDDFLNNYTELTLYDTASMHKMISSSTSNSYSVKGTSVSTNEITTGIKLKTYKIRFEEMK